MRKRMSRRKSKKLFRKTASAARTKKINVQVPAMRGGIRL